MTLPENWGRPVNTGVPARETESFDEILDGAVVDVPSPSRMSPFLAVAGMALAAGAGVLVVGLILFSPVLFALSRLL